MLRGWHGIGQPLESTLQQRLALQSCHGDVTATFKESSAQDRLERADVRLELVSVEARQVQPHPAVDVAPNRLWHEKTVSLHDRTDWDALRFMKIWGQRDALDLRMPSEIIGRNPVPTLTGFNQLEHLPEFVERLALKWHVRISEQRDRDLRRVMNAQCLRVNAGQAIIEHLVDLELKAIRKAV